MLAHPLPLEPATGAAGPEPAEAAADTQLQRAWHARLRPRDAAEAAAVETLVAGVRRRARIDVLEERVLDALALDTLAALPALAALGRCRARIERGHRLALDELRLLRGLAARRAAAAPGPGRPVARVGRPAHAAPEPGAVAPRAGSHETADGRAGRPHGRAQAAPEPAAGGPPPLLAVPTADPLALAAAAALPGRQRDFEARPDWRASTSRYAVEAALMAAVAG